ncbi:ATP-binding protein [Taibaiella chishuiensis]|uniref:ATPase family protein associated with various cellular activities (AAA) n=1 Tax=Taibaiella chishuiensis TaxID=1434707 RepID=A0A2P8D886_9BACT|nr:ATP-binding protein [Taibaiella chishuiensis]PSK93419.1 ATPase family protein associated with various cellular activities (AAA) [Taibaiella chishuiensis]
METAHKEDNPEGQNSPPAQSLSPLQYNAESLARELTWFAHVVNARLDAYFNSTTGPADNTGAAADAPAPPPPPDLQQDGSVYAGFVQYYGLTTDERLLLMLALVPHLQPQLLDVFFTSNKSLGRGYTEFGGVKGSRHGGFLPTIETAMFILSGNDLARRFYLARLFEPDHVFSAHGILVLDRGSSGQEPYYSATLAISEEYIDFFTTGKIRKPHFSTEFPAKQLQTTMDWQDLVVDEATMAQLEELTIWLQHSPALLGDWGMAKRVKPGYKVLFHGPPGTGKTLTASLLGKAFNLDVYRVDLSMVISKYIGETEKNLEKVFAKAENKNWILFFDEADALFGKRTGITDAHDKYANQEIAYLLQRLEDYPGLVILASNMRNNVDEAFTRRLQSIIYFAKPQQNERLRLWKNSFSARCTPPSDQELERLARQYELSGAAIMNIVQYASLQVLSRGERTVTFADIMKGVKREYHKDGKTV